MARQLAFVLLAVTMGCSSSEQAAVPPPTRAVHVTLAADAPVATVSPRYLSVAIDAAQLVGGNWWSKSGDAEGGGGESPVPAYDFTRPSLRVLAKALAPAYLRVGGSAADQIHYDLGAAPNTTATPPFNYVMTAAQWDGMHAFATALDFEVIFTLGAGPGARDATTKAWVPSEARALLSYAHDKGQKVALWELGNETNAYALLHGPSWRISGDQLAKDFAAARTLLDEVLPGSKLGGPASAYWPSDGELSAISPAFFASGGGSALDVVTWHYYPTQSTRCPIAVRPADVDTLFDPKTLDEVDRWEKVVSDQRAASAPKAEVWLGETGGAQCGGMPGVSDRFAGSFWWLDQLGRVARQGHAVMARQTLSGSDYGLIDDDTLAPRPDFWVSVLWRRLMGQRVLSVNSDDPLLRAYAQCTPTTGAGALGDVTYAFVNLDRARGATIEVAGALDGYVLTGALDDVTISLNGAPLAVSTSGVPTLAPVSLTDHVELPPASLAFVVRHGAGAAACR